jgi:hypothetical protein
VKETNLPDKHQIPAGTRISLTGGVIDTKRADELIGEVFEGYTGEETV